MIDLLIGLDINVIKRGCQNRASLLKNKDSIDIYRISFQGGRP